MVVPKARLEVWGEGAKPPPYPKDKSWRIGVTGAKPLFWLRAEMRGGVSPPFTTPQPSEGVQGECKLPQKQRALTK